MRGIILTVENQEVTISSIMELEDFCVVFDTNIYLNLYEYSPDATEFFIKLCNRIQSKLVLPRTVKREFEKNHQTSLNRQRNKFQNATANLINPVNQFRDKLNRQFEILNSFKFPMICELQQDVQEDIESLTEKLNAYTEEHENFEAINHIFLDNDIISGLIENIISANNLLCELSAEEIYQLCADGEKRYKRKMPPGYKDGEKKSGVQAYGDFIIWKETLKFCQENNKNLIFVTDDVKEDWYELENKRRIGFRKELISEFEQITRMSMVGVTSTEFFNELASTFNEDVPSTVEWIIGYDLENYFNDLEEAMIGSDISDIMINAGEDYVDTSSLSGYDGSDFEYVEDSFEIEVQSAEFQGYYNGTAEYLLNINVTAEAISREYWGRDDDSKDIILSPGKYHKLDGKFDVQVTRNIESHLDYWDSSNLYDELEIINGLFYETLSYTDDDICVECAREIGSYSNHRGEPICENCIADDSTGAVCTHCGTKVPFDNMYDGSTCHSCFEEMD